MDEHERKIEGEHHGPVSENVVQSPNSTARPGRFHTLRRCGHRGRKGPRPSSEGSLRRRPGRRSPFITQNPGDRQHPLQTHDREALVQTMALSMEINESVASAVATMTRDLAAGG